MKKFIYIIVILIVNIFYVNAQTKRNSSFDTSNLTLGGNFGLQFGDYTIVNISPQIGYNFTSQFNAGFGFGYSYYKDKSGSGNDKYDYTNHYVGMNLFVRYYPVDYFVLSLQPEGNRMWKDVKKEGSKLYSDNKFIGSVLIGGGVRYNGMIAMVQYDILQNDDSPYGDNVFYTIGYSFDF